jgi:hypothetical protein
MYYSLHGRVNVYVCTLVYTVPRDVPYMNVHFIRDGIYAEYYSFENWLYPSQKNVMSYVRYWLLWIVTFTYCFNVTICKCTTRCCQPVVLAWYVMSAICVSFQPNTVTMSLLHIVTCTSLRKFIWNRTRVITRVWLLMCIPSAPCVQGLPLWPCVVPFLNPDNTIYHMSYGIGRIYS